MSKLTIESVKARARALGLFLNVRPRTYAGYIPYSLYEANTDRFLVSSHTLKGITARLDVIERRQQEAQ